LTLTVEEGLIYVIGRHVTAEKEAAEALRRAEEQLRQAQKMEAIGQLTGGIAHDFNNLLTGILGSLELLEARVRQGRIGEVERYVTSAKTAADRAAALTHRLLAFARRQPLAPAPLDVNKLLASMEDLLRRTIGEAVAMEFSPAAELWLTFCDRNQLETVLLNLAINARDAMPEGGKLAIGTRNAPVDEVAAPFLDLKPGEYVCLTVADTGTGMTPEVMARAFDPFFTTKPLGQGTGLGLSMVYGFAKQSGGHVRIDSAPGKGATVELYLPRHAGTLEEACDLRDAKATAGPADLPLPLRGNRTAEARAPGGMHAQLSGPLAGEGRGGGIQQVKAGSATVLVIEDEPAVRELVLDMLAELGYGALEAGDGAAALKILRSGERVDLLLTDLGLPGMNGRALADAARELRPDLKVLFITGYAENASIARGFLGPGMAMVTKPFPIAALAARIRAMIGG
jgi:nitrogen-specific signal transduction histidine kinase